MLKRDKLTNEYGFFVHVYVEDFDSRTILIRHTSKFAAVEEAEEFYNTVMDHSKRDEELKYVLRPNDEFEYLEVFEHAPNGEIYSMKQVYD